MDDEANVPLRLRPGYLIRRLHQIHTAIFLEECEAFGITPVQYGLLTALETNPMSDQVTLGAIVGIDRTNVADVLERLAERGLVKRVRSERDRRSMVAFLTAEGERLMKTMYPEMQRAQNRLLEPLQSEFRPAFVAMLVQLIEGNKSYGASEVDIADIEPRKARASRSSKST